MTHMYALDREMFVNDRKIMKMLHSINSAKSNKAGIEALILISHILCQKLMLH